MTGSGGVLVLGIGNVLLRDEGVGVVVAQRIEATRVRGDPAVPPETRVVDGGTLGLDLLPMILEAEQVVMIDAVDLGREPGALAVLRDEGVQAVLSGHVSPHQVGVGDLVATARLMGQAPTRLTLVGIQPGEIGIGLDLSEPVAAAVDGAIELVQQELVPAGA